MNQVFINVVGMPASGKATLISKLAAEFDLNVVDGDKIRALLNEMVKLYQDPGAIHSGPVNDSFKHIVDGWRVELVHELLKREQNVVVGGGINPASRKKYQNLIRQKFPNVKIVMIHCQVDEPTLLVRLKERGDDWEELYRTYYSKVVKPPEPQEYDELLIYNQDNYEEIKTGLRAILNRI